MGLDMLPLVGTGKSALQLGTGKDAVTGEDSSGWANGIGLAAGVLPFGKLGVRLLEDVGGAVLKDGAHLSTSAALDAAVDHLGPGYKEIAPGVFKSADGTKMVRMTNSDLAMMGNHAGAPHMNFETGLTVLKPNGKEQFISKENLHIFLPEEK